MVRHEVKLGMTVYRRRRLGSRRAGTPGTVVGIATRFGHIKTFAVQWEDGTAEMMSARNLWKTPTGEPAFWAKAKGAK